MRTRLQRSASKFFGTPSWWPSSQIPASSLTIYRWKWSELETGTLAQGFPAPRGVIGSLPPWAASW